MTIKYGADQFIWEVINEAIALRKHATKEERGRLDFSKLRVMSQWECIYGQITGDCFSRRAAELIALCCTRYFHSGAVRHGNYMGQVIDNANGTKKPIDFISTRSGNALGYKYYSAIEAYITLPDAKNKNLIAYLRGEAETLNLYID